MKCSECGTDVPLQSRFCLKCGSAVAQAGAEAPRPEITSAPPQKKKLGMMAVVAGLVIVAILVLAYFALGRDKVTQNEPSPIPQQAPIVSAPTVPAPPQPGVLNAEAPKPPVIDLKKPEAPKPPQDVVAYLDHVKKVEDYRRSMRMDLTPAFDMLKKAYGIQFEVEDEGQAQVKNDIDTGYNQYIQRWQQIVNYFNSVRPPSGCERLASTYGNALGKYSADMVKIQYALNKGDASALYSMRGTAQADVDNDLTQADLELSQVCRNFGIPKSFGIAPDKGVDSLLSP